MDEMQFLEACHRAYVRAVAEGKSDSAAKRAAREFGRALRLQLAEESAKRLADAGAL